ncbi:RagB/SusD family nutrient uptake outer membrane protein [Runella aurantiaca]|uniref:RagB/SusD family nutrient uptake outer membrane protein n=2 Tax=Runella aurantiaca TaxID=2282308 RepID=A0A369I5X0_9BACT|nr:RagB/SusD family nutrient uptake outer membrane protein [Runella aurantiaca]
MKNHTIYKVLTIAGIIFFSFGCNKLVEMKPINEISDASYWKNAEQFKLAANEYYTYLRGFADILDNNPHSDRRSDILYSRDGANTFSNGTNTIPITDGSWNTAYSRIRATNYLLDKAATYPSPAEIEKYVAEAKFFRAYLYFDLLQLFGGVPIIKTPLSPESPELQAPRNNRDEVVDFIIADLESAIAALPLESAIAGADKGRVSKGTAQAFLSRVALYEGTWQKFRNNSARANTLLDKAIINADAVVSSKQYELFAPAVLGDSAQKYLFILENQQSNPANLTKAANKEYLLANRYDFASRQIRINITHQMQGNIHWGAKKLMDMYLCQDGLPIEKSSLFKGYKTTLSEYENRDNRVFYTWMQDGKYYWNNENPGARTTWKGDAADIASSGGRFSPAGGSGYAPQKFATERRLQDMEEAYDYPVIRYAEVLLNYAEAVFEKNGTIGDADLDKSLNLVRNRINKQMPKLSNTLVQTHGLDMRTEIRRERTLELFLEGFRVDDLKRWKTAETEMPKPIEGIVWTGTAYETRWAGIKNQVVNGNYRLEGNRIWAEKHYLLPVPSQQIQLNPNLTQNPGW